MRLGGPVFKSFDDPEGWIAALKHHDYTAAFSPIRDAEDSDLVQAYAKAAEENDIVIAEVPAFGNNPISPDDATRKQGIETCQQRLALADQIGARCCVNVAGSPAERWAAPHEDSYTEDTFDLIVQSVREIIDGVNPTRAFYTIEMMPWMIPDSADSNLKLLKAIDRPQLAVHFDPVNIVNSPRRYFNTGVLIKECFDKLGPHIKSCHAKDILMHDKLTVHLDEVRPGLGNLDYATFLTELNKLAPDTPLMLEHLKGEEPYTQAAAYVRGVAEETGVEIR